MKVLKWLAVAGLFLVGVGSIYLSTVGVGDAQAASSEFLTQAAVRSDVAKTSAATGTVAAAATYSMAFGEGPTLGSGTGGSGAAVSGATGSTWTVAEVLVGVGDRVTAGQQLATASTADIQGQIETLTASLDLAQITSSQADKALRQARTDTRQQLVDANTALEAAQLNLKEARVQRTNAAAGSPKRLAKVGVIQAQDQVRASKRLVNSLKQQLSGDFPDQTIALGQAQATVTDLESQLADLTQQLDLADIVAPVDGVVSVVNIKPGFVAPTGSAVELESATLDVIADVVESDISSLQVGQPATVTIDAVGSDVPGTVTSIAPSTAGGTSSVVTFPVTVTLTDPSSIVRPGMSSDVEITIADAPGVVAVPAVALHGGRGGYTVSVVNADGSVEARPVTVGLVTETLAEIQSGVTEGEAVVVGTSADRIASADSANADTGGFGGPGGIGGLEGIPGGGSFRRGGD